MRRVILICGPPGAGKTTLAHTTGLTVYDMDDPQWGNSEPRFRRALAAIGRDPDAQAVVIRAVATRNARAKAVALIDATETVVVLTPADECQRRVKARGRNRPPIRQQMAAVTKWWTDYEPDPDQASRRW